MSDAAASAESGAAPAEAGGAAGAALLKERRRQGLSLGDISRQLKLSVRQVEALERDDYSAYKGPVFIHGFIRNYAKLLGLDPEPLIRATDLMLNPPQVPAVAVRKIARSQSAPAPRWKIRLWSAAALVFLFVIASSFYFGGRLVPDVARRTPPAAAGEETASPPKPAAEAKTGAGAKPRSETRPGIEYAAKPAANPETKAPATTESVEHRPPPETVAPLADGSDGRVTVRMIFDEDSWVEIKDRDGNTIFGQLNPAGTRRSVSGEPPFSVVVGNAAGVRLFQGDNSIDLGPHTRASVARLTLQ